MTSTPVTALDLRQSGDLLTLHFSSDALPACRRVAAWREFFGRAQGIRWRAHREEERAPVFRLPKEGAAVFAFARRP